jgi:hypothetical protein
VLAVHFDARPRSQAIRALPDTIRALAATLVVFGVCGFGLVRLMLPDILRRYEALWVLPTGACAAGLTMTLLGFAAVPYHVSLALVLLAGAGLAVYAVRHRTAGTRVEKGALAWPVYLSLVVVAVSLIPMVFVEHFAAPVGVGSDAHMATGTAEFLKHAYPTGFDLSTPLNQMPPLWTSKFPIYYAYAAVSSVSGLATWQLLVPLAGALLALAAIGLFLVATEVFNAPFAIAVCVLGLAGLDRMALSTVLHPYFNQTWGFFALPFTIVLGWWVVQPALSRRARVRTLLLLVLFGLILVLAYPLAAPIPAAPLLVFAWGERRRRIAAGERVLRLRDLYRGRRSLVWMLPVALLLAVPVAGALSKAVSAVAVLAPSSSLANWGGDLGHFVPFNYFLSLPNSILGTVLALIVLALAAYGLFRRPPALSWGLGTLLAVGLLVALYFRQRQFGWYFHFKLLAFIGPLIVMLAVIGAGRLRRAGALLLTGLALLTAAGVEAEIKATGYQLPKATIALSGWTAGLPLGSSVRLDMQPTQELWVAYFMHARRLCSQLPLLNSDYPHVPFSRKADYIVTTDLLHAPADAVGPPLRQNAGYQLYRENPAVPGIDFCSQRLYGRVYPGLSHTLH